MPWIDPDNGIVQDDPPIMKCTCDFPEEMDKQKIDELSLCWLCTIKDCGASAVWGCGNCYKGICQDHINLGVRPNRMWVMKILVTGSRYYNNFTILSKTLTHINPSFIVHGDATGADTLAKRWAETNEIPHDPNPANWIKYGSRKAGPIRNRQMLEKHPDTELIVAFPLRDSKGTWDMIRAGATKGVKSLIIPVGILPIELEPYLNLHHPA